MAFDGPLRTSVRQSRAQGALSQGRFNRVAGNAIPQIGRNSMTGAIPNALEIAFAHHGDHVDTAEQLAAIAGVDVETVQGFLNDPASVTALVAYRTKLEASGALRPVRVGRALDKVFSTIEAELDKGVDGFEAVELSKPLIRFLESSERIRLAEKERDANSNLPVFNFIFSSTGGFSAEQVFPTAVVVDVAAKPVNALSDREDA
jgi:hypothetical protein